MSAAILPASPAADSLRRKRFTRGEVDRMMELGIFDGQSGYTEDPHSRHNRM